MFVRMYPYDDEFRIRNEGLRAGTSQRAYVVRKSYFDDIACLGSR